MRLHIQPVHPRLIPRISRLAHATALHRAPRILLLLQSGLRWLPPTPFFFTTGRKLLGMAAAAFSIARC